MKKVNKCITDSPLICADWGTTNLRLFLVNAATGTIQASIRYARGILNIHHEIIRNNQEHLRTQLFRTQLQEGVDALSQEAGTDLSGTDIILSGMASSSIGIKLIPYNSIPFSLTSGQLMHAWLDPMTGFSNRVLILSGLSVADDVMRGEEVQALGWYLSAGMSGKLTLLLPGTHSKHIFIENGRILAFKTYLTGELFQVLLEHSILNVPGKTNENENPDQAFRLGVEASESQALLHELFKIRALTLQDHLSVALVPDYLSGLLIGHELRQLEVASDTIHLAASDQLVHRYQQAMELLGLDCYQTWDQAQLSQFTIKGQVHAWQQITSGYSEHRS